ncbi:7572_t:CDS:2, partial [Acaulospora morrowiae]
HTTKESDGNYCLSWCPSRTQNPMIVVGCGNQNNAKIFRQDSSQKWLPHEILDGHMMPVYDVSWAPSMGRSYHLIATASKDHHVRIFKLVDNKKDGFDVTLVAQLPDHNVEVWKVEWNVTGTILSSSGDDGKISNILNIIPLENQLHTLSCSFSDEDDDFREFSVVVVDNVDDELGRRNDNFSGCSEEELEIVISVEAEEAITEMGGSNRNEREYTSGGSSRTRQDDAGNASSSAGEVGRDFANRYGGLFSEKDWKCPICSNINWARRIECNQCKTPKPGSETTMGSREGRGGGFMERDEVVEYRRSRDAEKDDEYDEFGRRRKKNRDFGSNNGVGLHGMILLGTMKAQMRKKMVEIIKANNCPEICDQTINLADVLHGLDHHITMIEAEEVDQSRKIVEDIGRGLGHETGTEIETEGDHIVVDQGRYLGIGNDHLIGVGHVQLPEIVGNDPLTEADRYQNLDPVNADAKIHQHFGRDYHLIPGR